MNSSVIIFMPLTLIISFDDLKTELQALYTDKKENAAIFRSMGGIW